MKKTFKFNLVEIALAIAIVAIGISSIMAIFPVGINATNDAVADNNIPDVAEYVLSYLEASTIAGWRDSINDYPAKTDGSNSFASSIPPTTPNADVTTQPAMNDDEKFKTTDTNGVFWFRQARKVDGDILVDFAAVVSVRRCPYILNYKVDGESSPTQGTVSNTGTDCFNRVISYEVEISYPAERPYSAREKVLYRLNVFNQSKAN